MQGAGCRDGVQGRGISTRTGVEFVRVISGFSRGRKLKEPTGFDIRPTSDMVKESIFNIVQFDIEGRRILDLYAGTGQLGIEALSRGAGSAVFIDSKPDAVKLIKENLKLCGFEDMASVFTREALLYLENSEKFDLIFVDPPYDSPLAGKTIQKIIKVDKLDTNGIIVCETRVDYVFPDAALPYSLQKEYKYGSVKITLFVREC